MLRTISRLDEILTRFTMGGVSASPKKVLFRGEGTGGIASYVAGWMASREMEVIVLDGANRFNPYLASSFARRVSISPEELLKRIQIARAFTCYQMATLMGERLPAFLRRARGVEQTGKPLVILLGPLTTFLDGDVPDREALLLFERALKKLEPLGEAGVSFLLFQPSLSPSLRRASLMKRLFHFSDLVWRISLTDGGPRMILEKRLERHRSPNRNQYPMREFPDPRSMEKF